MSPNTEKSSFIFRVLKSDIVKRGAAGAVGALLTATIVEALFPES